MDLLNADMLDAVKELGLSEHDEQLITDILYDERIHKNEEWSNDAVKSFIDKIDDATIGDLSE